MVTQAAWQASAKDAIKRMANLLGYDVFAFRAGSAPFGINPGRDLAALSRQTGRPISLVVDIGANEGQTTEWMLQKFPRAKVIAFEPARPTFAKLKAALGGNPRVTLENKAVGPTNGVAQLHEYDKSVLSTLNPKSPGSSRFGEAQRVVDCPVVALDSYCAEHGIEQISVLKIDAEGYDIPILEGAKTLLGKGAIQFVFIEFYHVSEQIDASGSLERICNSLVDHRFRLVATYTDYVTLQPKFFTCFNALLMRVD